MNYAYVCVIFGGDAYVNGASVVAKSLKLVNSKYPSICMIDKSISPLGITKLKKYFDKIYVTKIICKETKIKKYAKFRERYSRWINKSYTKWRCLQLVAYKKVLFLDADIVILKNIDDLFDLPAPAAIFESSQYKHQARLSYTYGHMKHGDKVDWVEINKRLIGNVNPPAPAVTGGCVLLEPSESYFCKMLDILVSDTQYGNSECYSGEDEQLILQTFNDVDWTNISNIYQYRAGGTEPDGSYPDAEIKALHWLWEKPWDHRHDITKYPDIKIWWDMYEK